MPLRITPDASLFCGALRNPAGLAGAAPRIHADQPCTEYFDWYRFCVPSFNQHGSSCVGWGWAHWLTAMIKRYVDPSAFATGFQINGGAVWSRGRQMFWGGDLSSGLYLEQGFAALMDLSAVPPGTELQEVDYGWDSVGLALKDTPIVQAHDIDNAWFDADRENGQIRIGGPGQGGHCTLRVGRVLQGDDRFYALANSWGQEWGLYGFGILDAIDDLKELQAPGLYTAKLPDGWQTWDGWKKLLFKP